jgi:CRP/FNR family transcriptional regulator, cyclic AMP receptor protein
VCFYPPRALSSERPAGVRGHGSEAPGEMTFWITSMAVSKRARPFDVRNFLDATGVASDIVEFRSNAAIYRQGDAADAVMYVQKGRVKLSVVSSAGKEAVVGVLGRGDFFGEGCLAGQPMRMGSVTAMIATTVLVIPKQKMQRLLHEQHTLANVFIAYILARNIRIEEDLVDQLFNSSEKRLARILLLLAQYGKQEESQRIIPRVSQEVLADMVGTTRSRVNFFMNKFRKLGFIEYNGELKINNALMSIVVHE